MQHTGKYKKIPEAIVLWLQSIRDDTARRNKLVSFRGIAKEFHVSAYTLRRIANLEAEYTRSSLISVLEDVFLHYSENDGLTKVLTSENTKERKKTNS